MLMSNVTNSIVTDTMFMTLPGMTLSNDAMANNQQLSLAMADIYHAIFYLAGQVNNIKEELSKFRNVDEQSKDAIVVKTIGEESDWMTLKEVSKEFGLPYNNLKSRKWRLKNKFPYRQIDGAYSTGTCNRLDVEEWLRTK